MDDKSCDNAAAQAAQAGGAVGPDAKFKVTGRIVAVLKNVDTGEERVIESNNLVTDAGEIHYAQKIPGETPTNAFGILELGSAGTAPAATSNRSAVTTKVASSQKAFDAGYPKSNDGDADNTGSGTNVVSYLVSYGTGEANDGAIDRCIITNATPGATEPVLMYATFTAFAKTSSDTLKFFVNHTLAGV